MNKQCKVSFNTHSSLTYPYDMDEKTKAQQKKGKPRGQNWLCPLLSPSLCLALNSPLVPQPHPDNWMKLHLCPAQHLSAPSRERESSSLVPLPSRTPSTTEWCPCESDTPLSHQCLLCHSFLPTPSFLSSWFFLNRLKDAGHISMRDLWIDNFLWCLSPASYILQ